MATRKRYFLDPVHIETENGWRATNVLASADGLTEREATVNLHEATLVAMRTLTEKDLARLARVEIQEYDPANDACTRPSGHVPCD